MKYVCLSFDDGLSDFYENALPILEELDIRCSINIICSRIDTSGYLTKKQLLNLHSKGYEIANHSYNHDKCPSIEDIIFANKILQNILDVNKFGYVTPYSVTPSFEKIKDLDKKGFLYCCDYKKIRSIFSFRMIFIRIINKFFKRKKFRILFENYRCIYSKENLNFGFPCFNRTVISRDNKLNEIKKVLKLMKNNSAITLMFHSIINNIEEHCDYPHGALTRSEFYDLLHFLKNKKGINIVLQKDVFRKLI